MDENSVVNPIPEAKSRPGIEKEYLDVGAIVVRAGCVYGASGSLTSNFFKRVEYSLNPSNKINKVTYPGTGKQNWAVVHVDELADAYVRIAESSLDLSSQIFNINSGKINLGEAFQAIFKLLNYQGIMEWSQQYKDDLEEALALDQNISSEKAKKVLGWNPKHSSFVEDIEKYYKSWKANTT